MDPALTLAIFEILTGAPYDSHGRPVTVDGVPRNRHRSFGVRIPVSKTDPARPSLASDNPAGLRMWARGYEQNLYRQVKVQLDGVDGKRNDEIWPCVTVVETDTMIGTDPYVYNDPFEARQGTVSVVNPNTGFSLDGTDQIRTRRHPDPYNVVYTIGAYSKDMIERSWIVRSILYILGHKGAISVERPDGSFRMVDYVLDRAAYFNQGEAYNPKRGAGEGEEQHLSTYLTYIFETHLDNSFQGFGTLDWGPWEETITQRVAEISSYDGGIWEGRINLETLRGE